MEAHLKALATNPLPNTTGWRAFGLGLGPGSHQSSPSTIEIPLIGWYSDDDGDVLPILAKHYHEESSIIFLCNQSGEIGEDGQVFVLSVREPFQKLAHLEGSSYRLKEVRENMMLELYDQKPSTEREQETSNTSSQLE